MLHWAIAAHRGREDALAVNLTLREGELKRGGARDRRAHAGDNLTLKARLAERGELLDRATKDHRVTSLEPYNDLRGLSELDEDLIDLILRS